MRKRFAMLLAAVMLLTTPALAEATSEATEDATAVEAIVETDVVEAPDVSYTGEWVFVMGPVNYGFDVYLPSGWVGEMLNEAEVEEVAAEAETTASEAETVEEGEAVVYAENVYYAAQSEDGAWSLTMAYDAQQESRDAAALQQEIVADYEDAAVVTINEFDFVRYSDAESDSIVLLLPEADGVHTITFAPASDTEFAAIADEVIGTISVYAFEGEETVEQEAVEMNESAEDAAENADDTVEAEG